MTEIWRWFKLYRSCFCNPTNKREKVTLKVLVTDLIAILGTEPARLSVQQVGGYYRWATAETRIDGRAHVPAVHTAALAGSDETCRWLSAAAGASGDRVLVNWYEGEEAASASAEATAGKGTGVVCQKQ